MVVAVDQVRNATLDRTWRPVVVSRSLGGHFEDAGNGVLVCALSDVTVDDGSPWRRAPDDAKKILRRALPREHVGDEWDEIGAMNPVAGCQEVPLPRASDLVASDSLVLLHQFVEYFGRWRIEPKLRSTANPGARLICRPAPSTSTLFQGSGATATRYARVAATRRAARVLGDEVKEVWDAGNRGRRRTRAS